MIKAEQIPDAVGEAAMNAVKNGVHDPKAVVAAALNAWPGMAYRYRMSVSLEPQEIILPLTQESGNE